MNEKGWIKIHRSLLDDDLYFSEKFTRVQAWLDLLLLAEYKPKTISVRSIKVELKRGQLAISIRDLASRWQWGVNKVQSFLKELESQEKVETQKSHTINVIAICNYDTYQKISADTQTDTQTDTQIDTQNGGKTNTQKKPINKGKTRGNRLSVDTQTDTQIDTQIDTQNGGKTNTQGKEKVTKKKYIEEIEEESLGEGARAITRASPPIVSPPKKRKTREDIIAETERRRKSFYNSLVPYVETYGKEMVRAFYDYWSELNISQTKMRWELQKTWELNRRLQTWAKKDSQYKSSNNGTIDPANTSSASAGIIDRQRAACINDIQKADELYYQQMREQRSGGAAQSVRAIPDYSHVPDGVAVGDNGSLPHH